MIAASLAVLLAELEEDAAAAEEGEETVGEGLAALLVDGASAVEREGVDACSAACVLLVPCARCIPIAASVCTAPCSGRLHVIFFREDMDF